MAACSASDAPAPTPRPPTPIPPTPTPRSTALPDLEQPVALLGGQERPLEIHIALPGAATLTVTERNAFAQAIAAALQPLSRTLNLADNLEAQVTATSESAALAALCSGAPVTAWVSAFTYGAAARACDAQPLLALIREADEGTIIGAAYDIVAPVEVTTAAGLAGQAACRVEGQPDGWAVASLMLQTRGLDPLMQMSHSATYPDEPAALQALLDGDCAALALPPGRLEELLRPFPVSDNPPAERLHVLIAGGDVAMPAGESAETVSFESYVVPFGLWVAAPDPAIPASELRPLRQELEAAVRAYFDDHPATLDKWFGASAVIPVDAAALSALRDWLDDAGWNMASVGR